MKHHQLLGRIIEYFTNCYSGTGADALNATLPNGDGGPATSGQFKNVRGLWGDSMGAVYLADSSNHRLRQIYVQELVPSVPPTIAPTIGTTLLITTIAGTGNLNSVVKDNIPATATKLSFPYGLAADSGGSIYVSEFTGQRIRKIATNGIVTTVAGIGSSGYSGNNGPGTSAALNLPAFLFLDSTNKLYWCDKENIVIRTLDLNTGFVTLFAGTFNSVVAAGDGLPATSASFESLRAIWSDTNRNAYLSDLDSHTVRKVAAGTRIVSTYIGKAGVSGITGDDGQITNALLSGPMGLLGDSVVHFCTLQILKICD